MGPNSGRQVRRSDLLDGPIRHQLLVPHVGGRDGRLQRVRAGRARRGVYGAGYDGFHFPRFPLMG